MSTSAPLALIADKTLLRFLACGSVDDGKSTLIGRLLYEAGGLYDDQIAALKRDSERYGTTGNEIDFALALDGLEQEREQGITIDVAYRYFSTPSRKFIVADTPGHEQFTRNMATGASNCQAAVLLVDARKGLLQQTRRHSIICSLLGIRQIILAVNKIDLIEFSASRFAEIETEFRRFATDLGFTVIVALPISARFGDNVTQMSQNLKWFSGPTLIAALEALDSDSGRSKGKFRFPVQSVVRPNLDFRGFAGTVTDGAVRPGMKVVAIHSGQETRIARIVTADGDLDEAHTDDAAILVLEDEIDLSRGDVLADATSPPEFAGEFAVNLIWLAEEPLIAGRPYIIRIGPRTVPASLTSLKYRINVNTLDHTASKSLSMNEVGYGTLATAVPVAYDAYSTSHDTGSFILIDRTTGATCGAGTVAHGLRRSSNVRWQDFTIDRTARAQLNGQKSAVIWLTGLSGSGKSTIANIVERKLYARRYHTMVLDGDNVRHGLNRDLGFTTEDRVENIRRVGQVAKLMTEAGLIVLCCFISPYRTDRQSVRENFPSGEFIEVFVDTPLDICETRDPKGLYAQARNGRIPNFTGVTAPYERPEAAELVISAITADAAADRVISLLEERSVIAAINT